MARPRRDWGSGSVFQDKHGQWWAKLPIGGGKTRRSRVASATEARETLKIWQKEQAEGLDLSTSRERIDRFLDRWLVGLQDRGAVKARTLEFYARHAGYGAAEFGHVTLGAIRNHHWRSAQAALLKAGLSPRSVNHVQTVLGTAFRQALKDGAMTALPFGREDTLPLGDDAFEAHVLNDEELIAFVSACQHERIGIMLLFILDHGLRHGEARALKRADMMLDGDKPHFFVRDSKSKAGRRRMPMTVSWAAKLREHYTTVDGERSIAERRAVEIAKTTGKLAPRWIDHGYVFPSECGTKLGEQNVNRTKQRLLIRAGLCDPCLVCGQTGKIGTGQAATRCAACHGRGAIVWKIRIHDLRHTAITDWIASGAPPKAAQALAGHSNSKVTLDIYAKSREGQEREAIERVEVQREQRRKRAEGE